MEEDADENIWVGFWGDGVQVLTNKGTLEFDETSGLLSNYVVSFLNEPDGSMLVGSINGIDRIFNGEIVDQYPMASLSRVLNMHIQDKYFVIVRGSHG